jgi:hypothetical protein
MCPEPLKIPEVSVPFHMNWEIVLKKARLTVPCLV